MTREEIESLYQEVELDRRWWGELPDTGDLLDKDFPQTADIYQLMPVCARIALHITGELPRVVFQKEPDAMPSFHAIVMNPEILSLKVSEKIRVEVFFGQYIHQLGHFCYSRDIFENTSYSFWQKYFMHLIDNRRIEARLVQAYPGYFYYLQAARKMLYTLAFLRAERELKFSDLDAVRLNYLATKIMVPELLNSPVFMGRFAPHRARLGWVDGIVDGIRDFGALTSRQVYEWGCQVASHFFLEDVSRNPQEGKPMWNYYSKVMMNLPLEVEGAPVDIDVKIWDDLFMDLTKSLDLVSSRELEERKNAQGVAKYAGLRADGFYQVADASLGKIDPLVLRKAKELATKMRLNFLAFQAKMDKTCLFYGQESGDLDDDELYQVSFNRQIFTEELPTLSAMLDIVVLLDLSGSMAEQGKLEMQLLLSVALALAFDSNPNISFSIYGHRFRQGRVEIFRFHEPGCRLEIQKLFSQEGMYVNADGFAISWAVKQFRVSVHHKFLLVISDGTPTAAPGTLDPRIHVRESVRKAQREGIIVLSLGISNFDQADMYDEFIPYSGDDVTFRLVQWFRRKLSHIADGAIY